MATRFAGTERLALRRTIAERETRLRKVVRRLMVELREVMPPGSLRHASAFSHVPDRFQASIDQVFAKYRPLLVEALVTAKADTPPTMLELAMRHIGDLITSLQPRQMDAVREQLAILMQEGPKPELLQAIADTAGLTPRQVQLVGSFVQRQIDAGVSAGAAARAGQAMAGRLQQHRSQLIARTEAVRYTNALVQQRAEDAGGPIEKQWVSARDENVDPVCQSLDNGKRIPMEATFPGGLLHPPAHPGCLPGDALITASPPIAAQSERWFEGDLVVIGTAGGQELTCTPNHPILTDRGWIPAASLHIGGHIIRHRATDRPATAIGDNRQQIPTRIEEIASAFRVACAVPAVLVPTAAPDFHGDGGGSQVAVIRSNRLLGNDDDTALLDQLLEQDLVWATIGRGALPTDRHPTTLLDGVFPTRGLMRRGQLNLSLSRGHSGPFEPFGFTASPGGNSLFQEEAAYGRAVSASQFRQSLLRYTGEILPDQVVGIGRIPFAGHVFNLETADGWFAANGIITHNCRCVIEIWRI